MEKDRLLIVGVGSIGERHVRCFQSTGRCEISICEPMEERRTDVAERYGVSSYGSLEDAIESAEFDAALIASPAPFHIPMARQLAARGVNLLIEKPLSLSLDGIDELAALIGEKKLKVSVGFNFRSLPSMMEMQQAIASGRFGRPVQVNVMVGQNFPFYRPAYREIYYARHDMGGGAIQDMLPHQMNAAEWMVGPMTRVVADARHCVLEGVDVEDTIHLITRHEEVMGSFSLNQFQPPNEFVIKVNCERGAARWSRLGHCWESGEENGGEWKLQRSDELDRDDYYKLQAVRFLDHLHGLGPAPCPLVDGLQTLKSIMAVQESVKTQKWVDVK